MRAAVLREYGEPLDVTDVPDPEADPHGVVVDVEACGICRSDWHSWQGHGQWADDQVPLDFVLGHEPAGTVVEVGERVESVREGDRVAVPFNLGCGACGECLNGHGNTCLDGRALGFERDAPGAFAERVHVPRADYNAMPLPDGVAARDVAALGCRFMTAFHGLAHRADLAAGEWVAVHGCGGVGLSAVHVADALGARVVAVDIADGKLDRAAAAGADATVNSREEEPVAAIEAVTGGGADVSMDALGRAETCRNSVDCLRQRGRHVQVGLTTDAEKGEVSLPTDTMTRWEVEFLGARGMPPTRYDELLGLLEAGELSPGSLVGREVGLDAVPDRLAAMTDYETDGVEVLTF
ncbi:alcohol dehydrogenase catalytic domain-containing protein [Candidatus Halobonum tyrrellensis]|uniref:Alcohol dehydrogenase zinc-binding domain-containing protein n=1 Tax=Candidatus Halobonum tyrrellensis G22 TaxID=1324957 RepID=V4HCH6_9EURY|nr:alcohol dehydrogenase catalytic domain-containing protein [Candidatus Halobonum tyrrellensis]ESP87763.1 alcohol dehydrogenase zinc-binding domain-containing protein [Candidatus Halobonum tyrrellensis G22]